jgi:hypothetical protein
MQPENLHNFIAAKEISEYVLPSLSAYPVCVIQSRLAHR